MKRTLVALLVAASAAAGAQTASKPATPSSTAAKPRTVSPASSTQAGLQPWIKLPPGIPRVAHGPVKVPFALRYEDIKIGTGPVAESNKIWHLKYTVWRAADGVQFDSWEDHGQPIRDKDGRPVLGPDGKPKLGDPEPIGFPQGMGRVIPGFDYGLDGMRIGGKRRLFVPWQMAYGTHSAPDRPGHPGFPPKSDLIFDVELVEVTDLPAPPSRPAMPPGAGHPGMSVQPGHPQGTPGVPNPGPAAPAQPATPPATTVKPPSQ